MAVDLAAAEVAANLNHFHPWTHLLLMTTKKKRDNTDIACYFCNNLNALRTSLRRLYLNMMVNVIS